MRTLVLLSVFACQTAPAPKTELPEPPAHVREAPDDHHAHDEVELAALMLRNQIHADKLWFAGKAKNWELAGFYLHELEETIETVIEAELTEDGHDLSAMAEDLLLPRIEALEQAAAGDGADFDASYDALVEGCNTCHDKAEHGFIRIQRPTAPAYSNQDFTPAE